MKNLVDGRRKLKIPWGNPSNQYYGDLISNVELIHIDSATLKLYNGYVKNLWDDVGIIDTYRRRNEFQLVCEYTFIFVMT